MKWSEIGLILLAVSAIAGLFSVVTGDSEVITDNRIVPEETDPLTLLEEDFSTICFGSGLRDVPSASADTIVRAMDLIDNISIHQANLHITRALSARDFDHVVTYAIPDAGLSFLCHTHEGEPLRFELYDTSR